MLEEKNAVINENQDNKTHFLISFIIFYFEDIDIKDDSDVEKTESE